MSAVLQLPSVWAAHSVSYAGNTALQPQILACAVHHIRRQLPKPEPTAEQHDQAAAEPVAAYAFYRKHTENMLRRYLYASLQIGRSPNLLGESVGRGWASSRRVRTFEDALIFVLDVERCLDQLNLIDRQLICRVVLQEYTHAEAAALLRISVRSVCTKLPLAIDCLTERLVKADLLILPD